MTTIDIVPLYVYRNENVAIHSITFGEPIHDPLSFDDELRSVLFSGSLNGDISILDTNNYRQISKKNGCHSNSISALNYIYEGSQKSSLLSYV